MDVDALLAEMDDALDSQPSAPARKKPVDTHLREEKTQSQGSSAGRGSGAVVPSASRTPSTASPARKESPVKGGRREEELDGFLRSLDAAIASPLSPAPGARATPATPAFQRSAIQPSSSSLSSSASSARCSPLTLSSTFPLCPRVLCLSCDHPVLSIPGFAFLPSADYLFLRTVVPNVSQLKARMEARPGVTAFCCQCSHLNCDGSARVDKATHRWICSGHY